MTFPVTPNPSIHTDPSAPSSAALEKQEQKLILQDLARIFGALPGQILAALVNALLRALGLPPGSIAQIDADIMGLIDGIESGLAAIVGGVQTTVAQITAFIDGLLGGTEHTIEDVVAWLQQQVAAVGHFINALLGDAEGAAQHTVQEAAQWLQQFAADADAAWNALLAFFEHGNWDSLAQAFDSLLEGLFGNVNLPGVLGMITDGQIFRGARVLQPAGTFPNAASVVANASWGWDPSQDHTGVAGSGAARLTAAGVATSLQGVTATVQPGVTVPVSAYVMWSDLVVTGSGPVVELQIVPDGGAPVVLASLSPTVASSSWTELSGSYSVAQGVSTVQVVLAVSAAATSGTLWFDDVSVTSSGSWLASVEDDLRALISVFSPSGSVADAELAWQNLMTILFGGPNSPANDVQQVVQSAVQGLTEIWNTLFGTPLPEEGAKVLQTAVHELTDVWDNLFGPGNPPTVSSVLQSAVHELTDVWDNLFGPGNPPTVSSVLQSAVQDLTAVWDNLFGVGNPPTVSGVLQSAVQDLTAVWDNLFGSGNAPTSAAVQSAALPNISAGHGPGQSGDLQSVIDSMVRSLLPLPGATAQPASAAATALTSTQSTLSTVNTQVQQIQGQLRQGSGGVFYDVNFASYPNGAFPNLFTLTTTGSGAGGLAISNGQAVVTSSEDGDFQIKALYTGGSSAAGAGFTTTDYQEFVAALGSNPAPGAQNMALLRMNDALNTYVYGGVYLSSSFAVTGVLGCYVNGVQTQFWSGGAPIGTAFRFLAGVEGNPYRFQGYASGNLVFDYTDTAQVSQYGPNYRGWGFYSATADGGTALPGAATYVSCGDNSATAPLGSGALIEGVNSGSGASGANYFPASFWNNVVQLTPDLSYEASTNTITISLAGWYAVGYSFGVNGGNVTALLYQDNVSMAPTGGGYSGSTGAYTVYGSFVLYCPSGATLQPGYNAGSSFGFNGQSILTLALLNRSHL